MSSSINCNSTAFRRTLHCTNKWRKQMADSCFEKFCWNFFKYALIRVVITWTIWIYIQCCLKDTQVKPIKKILNPYMGIQWQNRFFFSSIQWGLNSTNTIKTLFKIFLFYSIKHTESTVFENFGADICGSKYTTEVRFIVAFLYVLWRVL